jgi:hypothetical protein
MKRILNEHWICILRYAILYGIAIETFNSFQTKHDKDDEHLAKSKERT